MVQTNAIDKPDRLKRPERQPYLNIILAALPFISSAMLWIALVNLGMSGGGVTGFLKTLLLPVAAYMVSYAVYRMAIEKAATLVSVGFHSAAIVGLVSIIIVGSGLFMATMPGLVIKQVEERRLQTYASETAHYGDLRNTIAAKSTRIVPVIAAIANDMQSKADCEKASSCVSLKGGGGYGTTARTLETLSGRAIAVRDEVSQGLENREVLLGLLSAHLQRMETVLADEELDVWDRRTALRKLDSELDPLLSKLDEAVPVALLMAYAEELRGGVSIPNQPGSTTQVNALLGGYADSLDAVLGKMDGEQIERSQFPARTGAIQTFSFIGEFAPIAVLTFAVELLFPLTLWAYTVMSLIWLRYQSNPEGDGQAPRDSTFDDLTNIRTINVPKYQRGENAVGGSNSHSGASKRGRKRNEKDMGEQ